MTANKINPYEIALIQMDCKFLDIKANTEKAITNIRKAAKHGSKLICLPEGMNTGYLGTHISDMMRSAETINGETVKTIKALAKELDVFISLPIICNKGNSTENISILIDDDGEIVGTYSKTHPVGDEQKYFTRGTQYPVWETKLGKIACVICYDICFPETTRLLALKGAEVILVPSAWRASHYFKEWWDTNLACRAVDNLLYIAAANRTGISGDEKFAGKTQLCSPIGEKIASCGVDEEDILYGIIDIESVAKAREFNTVLVDRHPEDYSEILNSYKKEA